MENEYELTPEEEQILAILLKKKNRFEADKARHKRVLVLKKGYYGKRETLVVKED